MFRPVCVVVLRFLACALCAPAFPTPGATPDRLEVLARLVQDDAPAVRLEALRALAKIPSARAAELALGVLAKPMDPALDYGLWLTINDLAEPWIAAVQSGAWKPEGREDQLAFALKALRSDQAARVLQTVLGDRPLPRDGAGPWIEAIGVAGTSRDLRRLFDQAGAGGFDDTATARVLKALGEAARLRNQKPGGELSGLQVFLRGPASGGRIEAIRLAGSWKDIGTALPVLIEEVAGGPSTPAAERAAAFDALRQIGGEAVVRSLGGFASGAGDPAIRRFAAATLVAVDMLRGIPAVVAVAGTLEEERAALDFWRAVLGVKGANLPLREALEGKNLPAAAARAGMRVAREGGRDDVALVAAFAAAGGLTTDTQELTGELTREIAARALAQGDPRRGEMVFRRADLACTTCHAIGGAGGKVGPDLTSIGASAPADYLVESLLLPNAKIKEGYSSIVVETRDGEEYTGTLARETPEELVLRNASGQEVVVVKRTVARREIGRLSLMPSGLLEPLSEAERLDLVSFLSRLGKPGEFDASRGGVARLWWIGNVVHTDLQNNDGDWIWKKPLSDPRWVPLMALVNGGLSTDLLETATRAQAWTSKVAVVAATEIRQATGGLVRFRLNTAEGEVWMGGRRLGAGAEVTGEVPAGRHRLVVRLDPRRLPEGLRLEAEGAAFVLE